VWSKSTPRSTRFTCARIPPALHRNLVLGWVDACGRFTLAVTSASALVKSVALQRLVLSQHRTNQKAVQDLH
jgi:hypothetical protein